MTRHQLQLALSAPRPVPPEPPEPPVSADEPLTASVLRRLVCEFLWYHGPCTITELEDRLRISGRLAGWILAGLARDQLVTVSDALLALPDGSASVEVRLWDIARKPPTNGRRTMSTSSPTYSDVLGRHQVEIPDHLVADAEIPVLTGLQVQGDVAIVPRRKGRTANPTEIPSQGIAVVRGEAGGNTHLLVAAGRVVWSPMQQQAGQALGTVDVPKGATAYLLHPEHGANAMGPGFYELRRQREQADEIRLVAD